MNEAGKEFEMVHAELLEKPKRLSIEQEHAVELCCDLEETIVGITGGAGTGKTVVLGHVYQELKRKNKIALCAPTGRAAKRIQELTGIKAKTVHRLLEYPMPDDPQVDDFGNPIDIAPNEPRRDRTNPLDEDVVIVDESSMLSPTLYRHLMNAMPRHGVIRFFGDNNQLPPVEEGKPPFIEVLDRFPMVELTFNYRSDDEIVGNAANIIRGRLPTKGNKFQILYTEDPLRILLGFVTPIFAQGTHQIIMPTRKGKYGTMRTNPSLQVRFNGKGDSLRLWRYDEKEAPLTVRGGDKFLWIKNDYNFNMFNGEIGHIRWVDTEDGSLELITTDRVIQIPARHKTYSNYHGTTIDYDPRKQIELGYAITTHKAQGSEFDTVIYCMMRGQSYLLNRRNFYTAVTRAKRQVIVITDRKAMGMSMRKVQL